MFSLQTSSDEMLLLGLLSHLGWALSHSAVPPALPQARAIRCCGGAEGAGLSSTLLTALPRPSLWTRAGKNPWMVAIGAAKLLSQERAGSKWHSDDRVFAQRSANKLLGDHLAGGTGKSVTVQLPLQNFFWVQPLLHLAMQDPQNTDLVFKLPKAGPQPAPFIPLKPK